MDGPEPVRQWRVPVKVPVAKLVVGGLLVAVGLLTGATLWQLGLVAAGALGLAVWAARDLVVPVRLAADPAGVTVVTGFARRSRLAWPQIERVRVDVRRRSRMLELDTGEALFVFSRYDVDEDLDEVAAALTALRLRG